MHISAYLLQKFNHLKVSMQSSIMNRKIALIILGIDPSFKFPIESSFPCIHSRSMVHESELFIMTDKELHSGEVIFKSSEMEEISSIFIEHDGQIDIRPFIKIRFDLLVGFDGNDLIDRFIHC